MTGLAIAGVSGGVFAYGAVNNLEASGCDTGCGATSKRTFAHPATGLAAGGRRSAQCGAGREIQDFSNLRASAAASASTFSTKEAYRS